MAGENKTNRLRQVVSGHATRLALVLSVPILVAVAVLAAPLLLVVAGVLSVGVVVLFALMMALAAGERRVMRYE